MSKIPPCGAMPVPLSRPIIASGTIPDTVPWSAPASLTAAAGFLALIKCSAGRCPFPRRGTACCARPAVTFVPLDPRYNPSVNPAVLPDRRSIRLKNFDYAQPGAWFITICSYAKESIFGNIVGGQVRLSSIGRIVNESWLDIPCHFPNVELGAHVVMPNHFHALFAVHPRARHAVPLHGDGAPSEIYQRPVVGSVPTIVRSFKAVVSKRVREMLKRPTFQVWQRNYYESRICNERDAQNALRYIRQNPARWRADKENPFAVETR